MLEAIIHKLESQQLIWTNRYTGAVIRNYSNSDLSGYTVKKKHEFNKLTYWLNSNYIQFKTEAYQLALSFDTNKTYHEFLREKEQFEDRLNAEEQEAYQQIIETSSSFDEIHMKFQMWRWLLEKGAKDIEFKKRNYVLHAKDLQIVVQIGDGNITHMLDCFQKGMMYILLPYFEGTTGKMLIFEKSKAFLSYLEEQENENQYIQQFFVRSKKKKKGKSALLIPAADGADFQESDLVEFMEGRKTLRGIILDTINPGKPGIRAAKRIYNHEVDSRLEETLGKRSDLERALNIRDERMKFNWKIDDSGYPETRLLVKHPKKTTAGVMMEYYAVRREDILTQTPVDIDEIMEVTKNTFYKSDDMSLNLYFTQDSSLSSNAAYNPTEHDIAVALWNVLQLVIHRFIHEGLHPSETVEMLIAHELGHADPKARYLFDDHFYNVIERINQLNHDISEVWHSVIMQSLPVEEVEQVAKWIEERIEMEKAYKKLELQGERDAFQYGIPYISEYLHPIFEQESLENYLGYRNVHEQRITSSYEQLYVVRDMLLDYRQSDFAYDDIFKMVGF